MSNHNEEETKRSCVSVSTELDARLKKYIPWGQQEQVLRSLLELLADTCEKEDSNIIIYHILDGGAELKQKQ